MSKQTIYINSIASTFPEPGDTTEFVPGKQIAIVEPDYKTLIPDATLRRRMSRFVRLGVATGMQCLNNFKDQPVDAILTATGYGCLEDSEKFMNNLLNNEEQMLTPTAFIQSTFNTIGAQIAQLSQNHGYNNTYTHRAHSFESALLDAISLLEEAEAHHVLVGAMDEMTPTLYRIMERLRLWRHAMAGEGAHFAVLSDTPSPEVYATLHGIEIYNAPYDEDDIERRISAFLRKMRLKNTNVILPDEYKDICGEYPTAMGYAFADTCQGMRDGRIRNPVLLTNNFMDNHSLILLKPV